MCSSDLDLVLSRRERQARRRRDVGKLLETETAVREPRRVEQRRRDDPFVLHGEELIARHRIGPVRLEAGGDGLILVVLCVHDGGLADLAEVGETFDGVGVIPGFVEGGEEDGDEDGDDGDDDEKLDEGETWIFDLRLSICDCGASHERMV